MLPQWLVFVSYFICYKKSSYFLKYPGNFFSIASSIFWPALASKATSPQWSHLSTSTFHTFTMWPFDSAAGHIMAVLYHVPLLQRRHFINRLPKIVMIRTNPNSSLFVYGIIPLSLKVGILDQTHSILGKFLDVLENTLLSSLFCIECSKFDFAVHHFVRASKDCPCIFHSSWCLS